MQQIESLREELHRAIEEGNEDVILDLSIKLDALILYYTKKLNILDLNSLQT